MLVGRLAIVRAEDSDERDFGRRSDASSSQQIGSAAAAGDTAARTPAQHARSRWRVEIAFSDFGEVLGVLVEFCFVAIEQVAQGGPFSFVMHDPIPFRITGKFRKDLGNVPAQFLTFRN
jgi:hypothetical protein